MKLIGLTGGIASGKSTVSAMFAERGFPIIDADVVAREVVAPGSEALAQLEQRFPGVVVDGVLDRAALGQRVFNNDIERGALNAIVHPKIRQRVLELTLGLAELGTPVAIYDAPLLIENKLHEGLDGVIVVTVPEVVQRERLMARNQLSEADANARIAAQLPLEVKRHFATWLIDNAGTVENTRAQVQHVAEALKHL